MVKDEDRPVQSDAPQRDQMSEAEIDKNLMDSFPASDPPSWTLGTEHREETRDKKSESGDDAHAVSLRLSIIA